MPNNDSKKIEKLVQFLDSTKKTLTQYEAYCLRDNHINAFEEFTLERLREIIRLIEQKLGESQADKNPFGTDSSDLKDAARFGTLLLKTYQSVAQIPSSIKKMFLEASYTQTWMSDYEPAEVYESMDEETLYHYEITKQNNQKFVWLKWYSGDTEVGGIFEQQSHQFIAVINDGAIEYR